MLHGLATSGSSTARAGSPGRTPPSSSPTPAPTSSWSSRPTATRCDAGRRRAPRSTAAGRPAVPVPLRRQALGGRRPVRRRPSRRSWRAPTSWSTTPSRPTADPDARCERPTRTWWSCRSRRSAGPAVGRASGDRLHGPGRVRLHRLPGPARPAAGRGGRPVRRVGRRAPTPRSAALAAVLRARRTGRGEHVDVLAAPSDGASPGACSPTSCTRSSASRRSPRRPASVELPSIEPTADGWVGFNTNTRQQFDDFLSSSSGPTCWRRRAGSRRPRARAGCDEWNAIVHAWTTRAHDRRDRRAGGGAAHPGGAGVRRRDRARPRPLRRARRLRRRSPTAASASPGSPYPVDGATAPGAAGAARSASTPAERSRPRRGAVRARGSRRARGRSALPLAGVRVLDCHGVVGGAGGDAGCWRCLGADVIHVESVQHPDGMRITGAIFVGQPRVVGAERASFLAANTDKRGITLDLPPRRARPVHRAAGRRRRPPRELLAAGDRAASASTGRAVHALNPRAVMVRMPAFGLDGPWRDRVGFAQTMEQVTGMAWITGHRDDQPRIPRGPCDPMAGDARRVRRARRPRRARPDRRRARSSSRRWSRPP